MKIQYRCQECGEPIITYNGLVEHLQKYHKIPQKGYYDKFIKKEGEGLCGNCGKPTNFMDLKTGYNKYCSRSCISSARGITGEILDMKCEICQFTITGQTRQALANKMKGHLKTHNKTIKEYYDDFLKKPGEGSCKYCGKPTTFDNMFRGYSIACCGRCAAYAVRKSEMVKEREFRAEQKEIKLTKEEEYKNYLQELKDRVHEYDWDGERNTWAGGPIASCLNENNRKPNDLITNNCVNYIDGQEFSSQSQIITKDDEETNYDAVFWL